MEESDVVCGNVAFDLASAPSVMDFSPVGDSGFRTPSKSLLSLMKSSFSMSSLRDGSPDTEASGSSPAAAAATLPRRKRRDRRRAGDKKKDEFWEALQSNYDYLMDEGLIETCREANGELSCDDDTAVDVPYAWTFKEFLDRYDELSDWIEHVQSQQQHGDDDDDREVFRVHPDETKFRSSQMKALGEQSQRLDRRYPDLKDEIGHRMDELNCRWKRLEGAFAPPQPPPGGDHCDEAAALKGELVCQVRWLRKWLREVEDKLGPLAVCHEWSREQVVDRLQQQVVLQKEIESRCKSVSTIVKLGERLQRLLQDASVAAAADDDASSQRRRGAEHAVRLATNLQRRFHAVWIRSLEWQCWLEGLLSGRHHQGSLGAYWKDAGDEPLRKYRRLTGCCRRNMMDCVPTPRRSFPPAATPAPAVASAATVEEQRGSEEERKIGAGGAASPAPPISAGADHHDVGYSSESSARTSNDESVGEFVRVYTYTSAEATTPHVLEVVVDGELRPRRTPPRDDDADATPSAASSAPAAGPNCATFYFRHEDSSDGGGGVDHFRHRPEDGKPDVLPEEEDAPTSEAPHSGDRRNGASAVSLEGIHHLVSQAEQLVRRSGQDKMAAMDNNSSCDASGEYTSGSDSDVSAAAALQSRSCRRSAAADAEFASDDDDDGSVIQLSAGTPSGGSEVSVASARRQRRRHRRQMATTTLRDRPRSFVELSLSGHERRLSSSLSISESALHCLSWWGADGGRPSRKPASKRRSAVAAATSGGAAATAATSGVAAEAKCRSLGSLRHSGSSDNGRWRSTTSDGGATDDGTLACTPGDSLDEAMTVSAARAALDDDADAFVAANDDDGGVAIAAVAMATANDDLSSVSEQAWDDYQDPPYLSDAYSEQAVDDDAARKLLEFGDDYRAFIESHSDGTSTPSLPLGRRKMAAGIAAGAADVSVAAVVGTRPLAALDSESDVDDLRDVMRRHEQQLSVTDDRFRQLLAASDESATGVGQVLATCVTHLGCLEELLEQLGADRVVLPGGLGAGFRRAAEELRAEWRCLLMAAEEFRGRSERLQQLRNEVKALRQRLLEVAQPARWSDDVAKAESCDSDAPPLEDATRCLSELNFRVHSFVSAAAAATGSGGDAAAAALKLEVVELYRMWEQAKARVDDDARRFREARSVWECYEKQRVELSRRLSPSSGSVHEVAPDVTDEEMSAFVERFAQLRNMLESTEAWSTIAGEASAICEQVTALRRPLRFPPTGSSSCEKPKCSSSSSATTTSSSRSWSLLWRVLRAALPFQLVVVVVFCLACVLEPHCCENVNNMHYSLAPHLTYIRGPPPV